MKSFPLLLLAGLLAMASCTPRRTGYTNYMQNAADTSGKPLAMPEPAIQKADLLSIKVYSFSAAPNITDAPYNLPEQTVAGSSSTSATAGFLVDQNGNIEYPRIGLLHVEGMTKAKLADTIKRRLQSELMNPSVIVRFLNYSVTVLGEVGNPGRFVLPTERVTILEVLGLAGDVTDYANKNNVQVAREKDGGIEFGYIDLTSKSLFQSPYYRLQQNDVVFVEQNRRKSEQLDQQLIAQRISIFSTVIGTLAIVLSLIRR